MPEQHPCPCTRPRDPDTNHVPGPHAPALRMRLLPRSHVLLLVRIEPHLLVQIVQVQLLEHLPLSFSFSLLFFPQLFSQVLRGLRLLRLCLHLRLGVPRVGLVAISVMVVSDYLCLLPDVFDWDHLFTLFLFRKHLLQSHQLLRSQPPRLKNLTHSIEV